MLWWSDTNTASIGLLRLWGDSTNQVANYLGLSVLLLVVFAMVSRWLTPRSARGRELLALGVGGVIALLLALGPALKAGNFAVQLPVEWDVPLSETRLWLPTALLYENVPGFTSLRATYRFFTATRLSLILLACVGLAAVVDSLRRRLLRRGASRRTVRLVSTGLAMVAASLVLVETSTDLKLQIHERSASHAHVTAVRDGLLQDLKHLVQPGDRILLLPASNDFLATALIPFTAGSSYNVGPDKNLAISMATWPETVTDTVNGFGGPETGNLICAAFAADVDLVVLPSFSLWSGAISWPPPAADVEKFRARAEQVAQDPRFSATALPSAIGLRPGPQCR